MMRWVKIYSDIYSVMIEWLYDVIKRDEIGEAVKIAIKYIVPPDMIEKTTSM